MEGRLRGTLGLREKPKVGRFRRGTSSERFDGAGSMVWSCCRARDNRRSERKQELEIMERSALRKSAQKGDM